MEFRHQETGSPTPDADAIVLGKFSDQPLIPPGQIPGPAAEAVHRLCEAGEFAGKAGEAESLVALNGTGAKRIIVTGLGPRADFDARTSFRSCAAAAKLLARKSRGTVVFHLGEDWNAAEVESGVAGVFCGTQGQDLYRREKRFHPIGQVVWAGGSAAAAGTGSRLGQGMQLARQLVNEPASTLTPMAFAGQARQVADECGLGVEVWDEQRLEQERCGAFLAVSRGSSNEACLVKLVWQGRAATGSSPDLALIGKGVTFDSGGLSLKSAKVMPGMKKDMAGAATVLAAMQTIARLELPVHVEAWMGMVENTIGDDAYRPGDILTARSGKTIEVHSTDAEGRLVLADLLSLASESEPTRMIDLATLTGACITALGREAAGAMSNDDRWCGQVIKTADDCGERLWQLPMYPEYEPLIEGEVGDLRNVGKDWGEAGASVGAMFLAHFVGPCPWIHIDMAGPSSLERETSWADGGATGALVRTLVNVARQLP